MGIETEYGVSSPGHPHANAMLMSSQVVTAYDRSTHAQRNSRVKAQARSMFRHEK